MMSTVCSTSTWKKLAHMERLPVFPAMNKPRQVPHFFDWRLLGFWWHLLAVFAGLGVQCQDGGHTL
ncbi:hypothetical protein E2C01_010106 [Portunus trituberculatus]|uniref:Uncharacterized protein n=1 Tax=Portunus trituberculatus TaxID=210409 RepID=A0A5B7D7R6_PORTR|nr:hypothetical protein [Portunus trituberculatus]